jgi:uncharacterized protein
MTGEKSAARLAPCPICGKPHVAASRPFCSERCRDVDLHRWFSASYAVPAGPLDADDGEAAADGGDALQGSRKLN